MSNNNINLGVVMKGDAKQLNGSLKQSADNVGKLNIQLANLSKTFEGMAAGLINQAKALQTQTAAAKEATKAGKQQYTTQNQLIKQQRVIDGLFMKDSRVAQKMYLTSMQGCRNALRLFNKEAAETIVINKGVVKTLADTDMGFQRFMMKGNMVARTMDNMATKAINLGKNLQWTGRQMMVGITLPIVAGGALAIKTFISMEKAALRARKLVGALGAVDGSKASNEFKELDKQARTLSTTLGETYENLITVAGEFKGVGFSVGETKILTELTTQFDKLSNIGDLKKTGEFVRVMAQTLPGGVNEATKALAYFNRVDEKLSIDMNEIISNFPEVANAFKLLGVGIGEGTGMLSAFKANGIDVNEGVTAITRGMSRLAAGASTGEGRGLKQLKEFIDNWNSSHGDAVISFFDSAGALRPGNAGLMSAANAFAKMNDEQQINFSRLAFGTEQYRRLAPILNVLAESQKAGSASQNEYSRAVNEFNEYLADTPGYVAKYQKSVEDYQNSPAVQFENLKNEVRLVARDIGVQLLPTVLNLMKAFKNILQRFQNLSPETKELIKKFTLLAVAVGPITYMAGQLILLFTQLGKFAFVTPIKSFFKLFQGGSRAIAGSDAALEAVKALQTEFADTKDVSKFVAGLQVVRDQQTALAAATDSATNSAVRQKGVFATMGARIGRGFGARSSTDALTKTAGAVTPTDMSYDAWRDYNPGFTARHLARVRRRVFTPDDALHDLARKEQISVGPNFGSNPHAITGRELRMKSMDRIAADRGAAAREAEEAALALQNSFKAPHRNPVIRSLIRKNVVSSSGRSNSIVARALSKKASAERVQQLWDTYAPMLVNPGWLTAAELKDKTLMGKLISKMDKELGAAATPEQVQAFARREFATKFPKQSTTSLAKNSVSSILGPQADTGQLPILPGFMKTAFAEEHTQRGTLEYEPAEIATRKKLEKEAAKAIALFKKTGVRPAKGSAAGRYVSIANKADNALKGLEKAKRKVESDFAENLITEDQYVGRMFDLDKRLSRLRVSTRSSDPIRAASNEGVRDRLNSAFKTQIKQQGASTSDIRKGMRTNVSSLGLGSFRTGTKIKKNAELAGLIRDQGVHMLMGKADGLPEEFWELVGRQVHGGLTVRETTEILKKKLGSKGPKDQAAKDARVISEAVRLASKDYFKKLMVSMGRENVTLDRLEESFGAKEEVLSDNIDEHMKGAGGAKANDEHRTSAYTAHIKDVDDIADRKAQLDYLKKHSDELAAKVAETEGEMTAMLAAEEARIDDVTDKEVAKRRGIEDKRVLDAKAAHQAELAKLHSTAARLRTEQAKFNAERDRAEQELHALRTNAKRTYFDKNGNPLSDDELDTMVTARQADLQRQHDVGREGLAARSMNRSDTKTRQMIENSVIGTADSKVKRKVADSLKNRRRKDITKFWLSGGLMGNAYGDVGEEEMLARGLLAERGEDITHKAVRKEMGKKSLGDRARGAKSKLGGSGGLISGLGKTAKKAPGVGYNILSAVTPGAIFKGAASGVGKFAAALTGAGGKMGIMKNMFGQMLPMVDMFTGGMGSAALTVGGPLATGLVALGPLIPVIALVAAAVFLIWKNWDKVKKGISGGLEALKDAFNSIKDAVIKPFSEVFDRMNEKGNGMSAMWKGVGKILNGVFHVVAITMKTVAAILKPIMTIVAEFFYVLVKIAQFIIGAFTLNFNQMGNALKGIFASTGKMLLTALLTPIKWILQAVGKLAGISLLGVHLVPKGVRNAIDDAADFIGGLPEKFRKAIDPKKTKAKEAGRKNRDAAEDGLNEGGAITLPPVEADEEQVNEAAEKLRDEFMNQMRNIVDGWKEAAMDAFEAMADAKKQAIDDQIKEIDRLDKREEELQRERDYRAKRQELIDKKLHANNQYARDVATAVNEGRMDDARGLMLDHKEEIANIDKEITDTDQAWQDELVKAQHEAEKQRLSDQKETLTKQLEAQKDNLQKQLDAMTEFLPRSAAAAKALQDRMIGVLGSYGASYAQIGEKNAEAWGLGWSDAMSKAKKVVADQAYWAGDEVLGKFAEGLGVPKEDVKNPGMIVTGDTPEGAAAHFGGLAQATPAEALAGLYGGLRYHTGGWVGGNGDIPATLQSGEFVMRRSAVNKMGRKALEDLNEGRTYHEGGFVNALGRGVANGKNNLLSGGSFGNLSAEKLKQMYVLNYLSRHPIAQALSGGGGVAAGGDYLISALASFLTGNFPGSHISSLLRPGAITSSGHPSLHGVGRAVDIGGSRGVMKSIFDYVLGNTGRFNINELIFEHQIWKHGRGLYRWNRNDHMDHVHVGVNGAVNAEALKQLRVGGDILRDGPAYLHRGERVLTAPLTAKLDRQLDGDGGVTIYVENFIGQPEWFKKMMSEYNVKIATKKDREFGRENRTISSYADTKRGYR